MSAAATNVESPSQVHEIVRCTHCALPVPRGLIEPGESEQFCCAGCKSVYRIVHHSGLDRYYELRRELEHNPESARTTGERYDEMDDPEYHSVYVKPNSAGGVETELLLEGVHCPACVWLVERVGRVVPGVRACRLDLRQGIAHVSWDPSAVDLSKIARGLDGLGYPPHPPRGSARRDVQRAEARAALVELGVAGFLAGNIMLLSFSLYGGMLQGMAEEHRAIFRWLSAGLGMLVLIWPGRTFFRGAWAALRTRSSHLDLPIALALGVGALWGLVNTVRGTGEIYFDSLSVLVFLLLVGRNLQRFQQRKASSAVDLIYTMTPTRARRVDRDADGNESISRVSLASVQQDDLVEVRAGEVIPADGVIELGMSTVDASMLTGEPRPVPVEPGHTVAAGTVNGPGVMRLRVRAVGERSRVGRLMQQVAEASTQHSRWVRLADRVAGGFVVLVIAAAALTLWSWWPAGAGVAIEHATALLIVSCPCALGLATPLVMSVACGRLARRGVLVKGGDVLERLARPGVLFTDKTGTLTEGSLRVLERLGDDQAWALAALVEERSNHAVARTLIEHLRTAGIHPPAEAVANVTEVFGRGICGDVTGTLTNHQQILVGSRTWLDEHHIEINPAYEALANHHASLGHSTTWVAVDGEARGIAVLGDAPRAEAKDRLDALRARGWSVRLLTGDRADAAQAVASELGFEPDEVEAELSPEDKLARVRQATHATSHTVVMLGDGVNDAAAMAAVDVGIAVRGGAEASLEAADVYLQAPGLEPLGTLMRAVGAVRTRLVVCLVVSLGYNLLAGTAAVVGLIGPLAAAVLMPLSSLSVLTIATLGVGKNPR